jgi:bifunctional enzyme CysN/CysC
VVWLTGIPSSGKTTIATAVDQELSRRGHRTCCLDGDLLRAGLNADLGYSVKDREESIRRMAEVAKLMTGTGAIVIVAMVSPLRSARERARQLFGPKEFVEVHVDTPIEVAERRDRKGLYRLARRGELTDMTGVDAPYEAPQRPELRLDTTKLAPHDAALAVIQALEWMGRLTPPAG